MFCDLGDGKATFLPSKGWQGRELRETRRACVLGVDNLILMTKLRENIDGNKKESVRQRESAQEK